MNKGIRIGRISNLLAPGYSHCKKCHTNWRFVKGHSTYVPGTGRGLFPLCEQCWEELTPEQRLPYYQQLYNEWKGEGYPIKYSWGKLKTAILEEPNI